MQANIELNPENNFLFSLLKNNGKGISSTFSVPLDVIEKMMDFILINKKDDLPTNFNLAEDEEDFFQTIESRNLYNKINASLIINTEGFWIEIGSKDLKACIIYGPIRFKIIKKIIDLNWPVEIYLPIYRENLEEDDNIEKNNIKKLTKEEQENLMKYLEEQERRGEI